MKKIIFIAAISFFIIGITNSQTKAQTTPPTLQALAPAAPWSESQLIEPAALSAELKNPGTNAPLIYNIGAVEDIKGAKHIGAVSKAENLEKFKNAVAALPKNTIIIIYCGCCPFTKCPNIRPAFLELKKEGFTNIKVLNLPTNLKSDWIAKGYPLESK
ncbi:rhodanese-like domain-containing protein [Mucilaginibacter sp.]|uniref:rhodanese-like domain-containing protein n=1 Tax=Mucilaginibacter sp. TaxID=1882438 RepID=UPI0028470A12|nr:rhodanese-like domain-containing protein [Mucilaginibacter sp.]MDR3697120.1 rhodanese-like domain-containing protein [Mucilaginibacter sp.]